MASRNVVLIGFMGSGKTETARALAARLGYEWVDTDTVVERAAGATVAQIFERDGEGAFRTLESDAVAEAAGGERRVIACGGGAVLSLKNLRVLQDAGTIVYLRASADALVERLRGGEGRPLLAGDPKRVVPALLAEREPAYRSAADLIVDTDGRTPEEIAASIEEALR